MPIMKPSSRKLWESESLGIASFKRLNLSHKSSIGILNSGILVVESSKLFCLVCPIIILFVAKDDFGEI